MKKVLIISYRFPPQLSTRSIQVARWVKYLPRYGWEPWIICADENSVYGGTVDDSLVKLLPKNVNVIKVKSVEPRILIALAGKVAPFLLELPDERVGWYWFAYKKALTLIENKQFDIICSVGYPHTSHLVGLILKRKTGIPWITYFSDLWVDGINRNYNLISRCFNRKLEETVIRYADGNIFVSKEMRQYVMQKYHHKSEKNTFDISQSYDSEVFYKIKRKTRETTNSKFTITMTGHLYGNKKKVKPFFKALKNILAKYPKIYHSLTVKIIGKPGLLKGYVNDYELTDLVGLIDTVPYFKSLEYMARSDILLSICFFDSARLHPSKVAEYLGFQKPILMITPPDAGWVSFIKQIKGGIVVSPEDVGGIEKAIMTLYQDYRQGNLSKYNYSEQNVRSFDATKIVKNLAQVFDKIIDVQR